MNGVTGPSGFMNDVTRPSDFINGVTRPSDGVSSRCLRCQIFEGGVGLAGVGVGGSKPFVQGCIFFIFISPRKFCTTSCKCFTVPKFKGVSPTNGSVLLSLQKLKILNKIK